MLKNYVKLILALVFASNVMAQNIPSYVPTNGLVGYWPFNGNANDESGNGNNGTVNGATLTSDRNGKVNSAYDFDGKNDINIAKSTHPLGEVSITYSVWVNTSSTKSVQSIIDVGNPGIVNKRSALLYINSKNDKGINYCGESNDYFFIATNEIQNIWNHYVITKNKNFLSLYVNGKLIESYTQNDRGQSLIDSKIFFGSNGGNWIDGEFFTGKLDDIAIFNRALSQQEITALYTGTPVAQNIPSYVPTNGLVGYWPFNGNANDESGNGNNGTVNGATLTADRNGKANSAYSFDGKQNDIDCGNNNIFNLNNFSISVWYKIMIKPNSTNEYVMVCKSDYNSNTLGYRSTLGSIPNNKPQLVWSQLGGGNTCGDFLESDNDTKLNVWSNVISIKENGVLKIYVDGKLQSKTTNVCGEFSNSRPLLFGSKYDYNNIRNAFFNGQLDDIAIYNRALSEQEITALYTGSTQSALASTKVFVDAPATVNQNQEVELSISTEALNTADNVIAYQTDFSYDTTRYTYVGNNLTGTLNPSGTVGINKSKNGLLQVGYMSQTALNGAGSLVKLKFKANNTTGQGIFGLANFMYNNTTISSLKSDTVTTLDVTPPTAKITYTQNPVRKGDSLLITVNFNEKMALSPVPQLNLTGQNTLSNTNLTKVNDTTYTFWWVVEKGNGAVNVTLATGKDVGGNAIVATPTQNASFSVLPTLFGDVDTNSFVRAYDAALALQYSVGLNPLPTMDPLPWSNWRIVVANVDTVGNVTANDASLILQKSIGQIATFPADAKKRGGETPIANVTVAQEGNQLVFRATGSLYACNVYMKDNFNVFGQPEVKDKNAMVASNITTTTYKVGLAATTPLVENESFLVIPILTNENLQGTLDIVANAQERSLSYGKAAGLTTINQEAVIVYPNPTKDVVTITNAQGKTLRIVDVQGKEVYNQKVNTSSMEVSMKGLGVKGMYLVHIVDANNESIQKQQIILE